MKQIFLKFWILLFLILGLNCSQDENKTLFVNGSGISSISLNSEKIEDLSILGKVWGFLKYYHPVVAKGKYNWDFELFKILPEIISCKNKLERNAILLSWVEGLGSIKNKQHSQIIDSSNVKCYPDLNWINEIAQLGVPLSNKLIEIKNAEKPVNNYYVELEPHAKNPIFTHEDSCTQFSYPDAGYRLLCLFRYWNCIQYYYPNKNLIGEDWSNVLTEFIPKFTNDSDALSYELTVSDMIARIHDTHAVIICTDTIWRNYWAINLSPVKVAFIENKAVVIDYYNKELGEKSGLKKGDVILKIKNQPVAEFVKEELQHIPASNYPTFLRNVAYNLLSSRDTLLNITYQHDSEVNTINLKCFPIKQVRKELVKYPIQDTCFKYLSADIGYFFPGSFKNEYTKFIMPGFLKTKGIVIDFRCYPSDDILHSFANYFFSKPTPYLKTTHANIEVPGLFTFSESFYVGNNNPKYYKGKIVVLVNERTQSQAEWDVMALQALPNTIVIGGTTAGADGNVSEINLIGKIKTFISGKGVYYIDGRETQRIGIVPDIDVQPTIGGVKKGRDELVEKAIEIINGK